MQSLVCLSLLHEEVDVVVVDARGVGEKRQAGIFVLKFGARCLEGAQRRAILVHRRINLIFVFIQPGKGVFSLPLQKYGTIARFGDRMERSFGGRGIMLLGGDASQHQLRIRFVALVAVLLSHGKRFVSIALGVVELGSLLGHESESYQTVNNIRATANFSCKDQGFFEGMLCCYRIRTVHMDISQICKPSYLVSNITQLDRLAFSFKKCLFGLLEVS